MNLIYATVSKKISNRHPLPPADYKFIQTNTTKFDGSKYFMNGHEIFNLVRAIIYCMNNRELLRCFATTQGTLCIFKIPIEDVNYLNSLLYQLVLLKNIKVGHVHYLRQPTKILLLNIFIMTDIYIHVSLTELVSSYGKVISSVVFVAAWH